MKNNNGFTIIELIGAIVIFGIIISLLSMLIISFASANKKISFSAKANTESAIALRTIEKGIEDLNPNAYDSCSSDNCIIFQKEYEYIYNNSSSEVTLNILSTPEEYTLKIEDNTLYINNIAYSFNGLSLIGGSKITFQEDNQILYITITFILEDASNNTYNYIYTYTYRLTNIPTYEGG